jgi:hypothetical protein
LGLVLLAILTLPSYTLPLLRCRCGRQTSLDARRRLFIFVSSFRSREQTHTSSLSSCGRPVVAGAVEEEGRTAFPTPRRGRFSSITLLEAKADFSFFVFLFFLHSFPWWISFLSRLPTTFLHDQQDRPAPSLILISLDFPASFTRSATSLRSKDASVASPASLNNTLAPSTTASDPSSSRLNSPILVALSQPLNSIPQALRVLPASPSTYSVPQVRPSFLITSIVRREASQLARTSRCCFRCEEREERA